MPQTLLCLAAVLAVSTFGVARHHALAAEGQAEARGAAEAAALATAERWSATLRTTAFDDADGLDRTETVRAGRGLVAFRVRVGVRVADPAGAAVVTVTEIRADARAPPTATRPVRITPAALRS